MNQVPNFEAACVITGDDPNVLPVVEHLHEVKAKRILAYYKLEIIHQATNTIDGKLWVADFSDDDQDKYTSWLEWVPSRSAFVFTGTGYARTNTDLGARFYFPDRDTARGFTEQHIDLINDLHRQIA